MEVRLPVRLFRSSSDVSNIALQIGLVIRRSSIYSSNEDLGQGLI